MDIKCTYKNLGIVIVTYNPVSIYALLERCTNYTNKIVVVDNYSLNRKFVEQQCNLFSCTYLQLEKNTGIAFAVNKGVEYLITKGISWFITFDQDSIPPKELISYYNQVIQKEEKIGLIGISYDYHIDTLPKLSELRWVKSYDQITSGLLHNIDMWYRIGEYKKDYFIDCVDFEYSLRAALNGYNTFTIQNKIMLHSLGSPKKIRILWITFSTMNHNSFRQYYIVRNHFWLAHKYIKDFPIYIILKFYHLFIRVIKTLLFDDNRKEKVKRIYQGLIDGLKFK